MKTIVRSFVASLLTTTVLVSASFAGSSETEVRQVLSKTYPNIKVGEIRSSDIPGPSEAEETEYRLLLSGQGSRRVRRDLDKRREEPDRCKKRATGGQEGW